MKWRHAIKAALSTNEMKKGLKKKNEKGIIREREKKKVRIILTHVSKKQGSYMIDEDTVSEEKLLDDTLSKCWKAVLSDDTHWIIVEKTKEKKKGKLKPILVIRLFQLVGMDIIQALKTTAKGN